MPPDLKTPDNAEIDKALKEFEMQASAQQIQKTGQTPESSNSDLPIMVRLVIKYSGGVIKDRRRAEYVLLGLAVFMFALSFYFFFGVGSKSSQPFVPPSPEELEQMRQMGTPIP